ncbi:MAG: hypothetical protein NTY48_00525, partial [Candidatus Diapherotrites archaeon]|nr:hypothetical protein [Candidatus Diapherotrites archaeon]
MTYKGESCIPVVAGSSGPASSSGTTPNPTYEFFFDNVGYSVCNDVINKILYTKSVNKVAPYSSLRDPSKPFFTLPLEDRLAQISQIRSQTGSVSSISSGTIYSEGENNTIPSIHFSLPSTTPKGNMGRQTAGDIYSYTPPNLLKTTPDGNVSVFARLAVGTDPLPVDYNYDVWNTILDDTSGRLYVCSTGNTKFNTFGYYGNGMLGGFITAGTSGTASNYQSELIRVITPLNERTSLFTQTYEMNPIEEGRVIDLGPYTYNVDPKWNVSNAGKLYDLYKTGDTWDISLSKYCNKSYDILSCKNDKGDYSSVYLKGTPEYTTNEFSPYCVKQKSLAPSCYYAARNATSINASTNVAKAKALCSSTEGLVPFELAKKDGVPYPAPDANIPFVEYHRDGKTYSIIDPASFPEGVRLFLKDGRIYAEYIGLYKTDSNGSVYFLPTENASPDINFTISRNSVAGTSYAILTVRDWINGSQKAEKKFQVKILGNETNCISPDGEEGLTGKSANLRLYYNWDWQTIQENQCDSSNINYTYCDATQYTISLFKKLKKIQDALLMSDPAQVSRYSTFFSYLLKDSYSQDFLNAFDNYYSSQLFVSDYFNTTEEKNGLDLLINSGRIRFLVRGDNGILYETGVLPYSGVYRTEITIYYDNPTEQQLILPDGSPGAIITITFIPYKQTGNQNPLYETPFDGKVGYTVGTDGIEKSVRGNYGTGYVGELLLNSKGEKALPADNALMNITGQTANDLVTLDKGTVLSYNGKTLKFTPSQPTPVLMKIEGTGGPVNAAYEYVYGTDKGTSLKKTWRMRASTIGTGCMDFNGKKQLSFLENIPSPRIRSLNWAMTPQNSSISLVTTYYTSRTGPVEAIAIKPVDPL